MKPIWRGWIHLATGAGFGRILGFFSNLLLTRWLGPADLGLFNLVTTTVQTTDTLVRCGGDYALNYELGAQPHSIQTDHGAQLARALSQLCSLTSFLGCLIIGTWVWFGHGLFPISLPANQRLIAIVLLLLMILLECTSASAWEILLVSHRTFPLALRQGLFYPLRLLFAAMGALSVGVPGAMAGWVLVVCGQNVWLRSIAIDSWQPFHLWPPLYRSIRQLLQRGLPFYISNILSSLIFYPLLLVVADGSGLADIGYLRVGQILQQLFAFLPSTLVPVLFLKLRSQSTFKDQVIALENPLRIIWFLLLEALLIYCVFDRAIISLFFGDDFGSALLPSRLLLLTALFECLSQLAVQPLLAAGKTRIYGFWQNGSALLAALFGWLWIPTLGISAYLFIRLLYVIIPLIGFGWPVLNHFQRLHQFAPLGIVTITLLFVFLAQASNESLLVLMPTVYLSIFTAVAISYRKDLLFVYQSLTSRI